MGWHVVRPFIAVAKLRVTIGYQAFEEAVQVRLHVGVRIFLDEQACGGGG
jgi:hypothetical protein